MVHADAQPGTVVVVLLHTVVADMAVDGPHRPVQVALHAVLLLHEQPHCFH